MMENPRLTFDTSCVMSLLYLPGDSTPKDELESLEQIQSWGISGRIKIFVSEKSRTEAKLNLQKAQENDPDNSARLEKWKSALEVLNSYETLLGRWILGVSALGVDTVLASDEETKVYEEMSEFLFDNPPDQNNEGDVFDLGILFEHFTQGNDLFVTRDGRNSMLRKKDEIKQKWNIVVCTPLIAKKLLEEKFVESTGTG